MDAEALLATARRPLVIGIGGGGDVVGALATAEACRLYAGAYPVVGGVTWERTPIDPLPGPRSVAEIEGLVGRLAPAVVLAGPDTAVRANGARFAESRMARFLGHETVLVDVTGGPGPVAEGVEAAATALDVDLLVFVDVGGDVLATGSEPGLASPLCDAVMLAAAARLAGGSSRPVLGAIFGPGCDGELTLDEVAGQISMLGGAGALAGMRGLTPAVAERLEGAIRAVPTEASAQAVRCFRGARGAAPIRGGQRSVPLSPAGATTTFFDVPTALRVAAPLAAAVVGATDLEHANQMLNARGVRTELDAERERAGTS